MKNNNTFQLFVITQPEFFEEEEKSILKLFDIGVSGVYLRKEKYSAEYIIDILKKIDRKFHHKLIVPFCFYDENNFKELNFIIHFKEKERTFENLSKMPSDVILSTSIHDLSEWGKLSDNFKFAFFSPVFESISKPNYKPKISIEILTDQIKDYRKKQKKLTKLIALGGINEQNILDIKSAGFDGAALLGSIWKSNDPLRTFEKIKMIFE